jgi:hypothetical protein
MKHLTLICALTAFLWPALANAHMKLMYPPSRIIENGQGDPQKGAGPCGPAGQSAMSKMRTKFKPGQTITVIWKETVHHPGHFRIAFDDDGEDAFKDPTTAKDIVDPPVMPVLKDNLFPDHTDGQMMKADITLPNVTCKNCTLQVIQAMTSGDSVTMYYHCADIQLGDGEGGTAPPPAPDAGGGYGGTGGSTPGTGGSGYGGSGGSGYPDPTTGGAPGGTGGVSGSSGTAGAGGSTVSPPAPSGTGGSGSGGGAGGAGGTAADPGPADKRTSTINGSFSGCAVGGGRRPAAATIVLLLAALLGGVSRRRRPRS